MVMVMVKVFHEVLKNLLPITRVMMVHLTRSMMIIPTTIMLQRLRELWKVAHVVVAATTAKVIARIAGMIVIVKVMIVIVIVIVHRRRIRIPTTTTKSVVHVVVEVTVGDDEVHQP